MGAQRPHLLLHLLVMRNGLIEQLRVAENFEWHHKPSGDPRFKAYLQLASLALQADDAVRIAEEET